MNTRQTAQNSRSASIMRPAGIGQLADPAPVCARSRGKRRPSMPDPRPVVECPDCDRSYRWTPRPDICLCGAALHDGWRSLPFILWERFLSILPANSGRREW
jgi:hypothetical protein